jgi:hypothetical protein
MAGAGDLQAIKEVGDRLDDKCVQTMERGDVSVEVLSDRELFASIRGEPFDLLRDKPAIDQSAASGELTRAGGYAVVPF